MCLNFNNITSFFKPNRQVWQDAEPAGSNIDADADIDYESVDSDIEHESETEDKFSDIVQVMKIIEKAKNECDKTKKAFCSLREDEVWDFKEVNRLRKFIDELDHVFFVKGEGAEKLDYTADRLHRLEEQLNMELIISEFLKAKSAKVKTYASWQKDKYPNLNDHIIFTYKDGSRKILSLETGLNPPALVSDYGKESEHEEDNLSNQLSDYTGDVFDMAASASGEGINNYLKALEAPLKEKRIKAWEASLAKLRDLSTNTYSQLTDIAQNLPSSFLEDASDPLSECANIISSYESADGRMPKLSPEDRKRIAQLQRNFNDIISDYFGSDYNETIDQEKLDDLKALREAFWID